MRGREDAPRVSARARGGGGGSVMRVGAGVHDGARGGHGAGRRGTRRGTPRVEARLRMRRATRRGVRAGREQEGEDGTRRWASSDPGGDCGGGSSLRLEREERRGTGQEEEEDVEGGAKAGGGARPVGAPGDLSGEGSQPRIGCDVMDGEARARCHRRGLEGGCGHGWRGARGYAEKCALEQAEADANRVASGVSSSRARRAHTSGACGAYGTEASGGGCEGYASPSAAHILMLVFLQVLHFQLQVMQK
ncbi:hypothetical protein DFH09DRAFT_138702 [Mycena vulgaris]|nr:hypothetical protein DFH09DRAFT_138702 [Mycena vulgaris]